MIWRLRIANFEFRIVEEGGIRSKFEIRNPKFEIWDRVVAESRKLDPKESR